MKLMIVVSRVPWPLDKGDKLRIYHQIKHLSERNHICLVALAEGKVPQDAYSELKLFCDEVHFLPLNPYRIAIQILKAFVNGLPLQVGYFYQASNARVVQQIFSTYKPDYVYGQLVRVAEYIKELPTSKTLDLQDALSAGLLRRAVQSSFWMKALLMMEFRRMKRYENDMLPYFDHLSIITQSDKDLLDTALQAKVSIISNGVDIEYFKPIVKPKEFDVVFTGNMNYPPNVMAAQFIVKKIMPILWNKYPTLRVLIAGANPHSTVRQLACQRVEVSGWVEDIRQAYAVSKVFVAPMQIGTGLQNKLLEAMAMGIPCVSSTLANEALQAKVDHEILVANPFDENAYALAIEKLLFEVKIASQLSRNGLLFIKQKYHWQHSVHKLEDLIKSSKALI